VAGAGITPAQAVLQLEGQHGVIPVVRAAHDKGAYRTELRLDQIGPGCVRGREAQPGVLAPGPAPDRRCLVRRQGSSVGVSPQHVSTGERMWPAH
jgi:hypothetical protein